MDDRETYMLLTILKEALGHPNYQNIRNEAARRLQEINDELDKPADLKQQVAQAEFAENPRAFPSTPAPTEPIEPMAEEPDDEMRRV